MDANDITSKAESFLKDKKVQDALHSEKAEEISDKLLDGVAGVADKLTGGKFEEQIEGAKEAADKQIGNQ
jgi:hypothetical protein